MKIVREPIDGWLINMNDKVGKRAMPGVVFRFGRRANECPDLKTDAYGQIMEEAGW